MTLTQKLALAISILGFLAGAGSQLGDIFSPIGTAAPLIVKEIISISGFAGGILGIVLATLTGQSSQVKAVEAMPGVSKIITNMQANATLKALADSDEHPKVEPPK